MPIDQLQFTFDASAVRALNAMLAVMVFGAALDVRVEDFRRIGSSPRGPLIGALAQFVLLPAVASLFIWLLRPNPSFGLGLLLVAACPGGAVSNFIAMLARGNVALSLTVSTFSTLVAMVTTPLVFFFWGRVNPVTVSLLREISVDPFEIAAATFFMLVAPTLAAMAVRHWRPAFADRLLGPVRIVGVVLLMGFIAAGFAGNLRQVGDALGAFVDALPAALAVIALVNVAGLAVGTSGWSSCFSSSAAWVGWR
jgi:BASS family bile acid:Na+ symporter